MGLFTRKKVEQQPRSLPEFPQFPDAGDIRQAPPVPTYESAFKATSAGFQRPITSGAALDIPQRQPAFLRQEPVSREREAMADRPSTQSYGPQQETIWRPPRPVFQEAQSQPVQRMVEERLEERLPPPEAARMEDKPVFVKIQQYREAMAGIELLKQKIQDIEFIIGKIEELRAQEQVELQNCQSNLDKIKEKLIAIDKRLFEV